MRDVFMVYDMFPPHVGSGTQRPLQFAKHLPKFGYAPYVVSADAAVGEKLDESPLAELGPECRLRTRRRLVTFAPGTLRSTLTEIDHEARATKAAQSASASESSVAMGWAQRTRRYWYPVLRAAEWGTWFHLDWALPVVDEALRAARERDVALVWASGPSSRNLIAGYFASLALRRPLVLDIRDPWTYGSIWNPALPLTGWLETRWAARILEHASATVFTSPLTRDLMAARFPRVRPTAMHAITNGYADSDGPEEPLRSAGTDRLLLSYVGTLNERRTPNVLLEALASLRSDPEMARDLCLQFVGGMAGHERRIPELGLQDCVFDVGRVSHADSVRYMWGADVNVLLQTIDSGQDVIAGKVFEYFAARRPILAVVSPGGGDAWLLEQAGAGSVVSFEDPERVAAEMRSLHRRWKQGQLAAPLGDDQLRRFHRETLTGDLARVFDDVLARPR